MTRNLMIPRREDLISPFEQVFDKFFEDFFHSNPLSKVKASQGFPRMNVSEKDGKFVVALSVPGMSNDDVSVEVDSNNILTVRGKMSSEHQSPEGATYYLRELRQSAFERSVQLPDHVVGDPDAVMKDGILKLSWETQVKPRTDGVRKIEIKTDDSVKITPEMMKQAANLSDLENTMRSGQVSRSEYSPRK